MAEQAKQEAKVERPQVRKVRFVSGVFLGQELHEIDLVGGRWSTANKASVDLYPGKGLVVRYTPGRPNADPISTWVPEAMIRQVDCTPEWKP